MVAVAGFHAFLKLKALILAALLPAFSRALALLSEVTAAPASELKDKCLEVFGEPVAEM